MPSPQQIICLFLIGFLGIASSCKQQEKESHTTPANDVTNKTLQVRSLGLIRFRRTYANIQFMDNEKEIDRYLEKQRKSNPLWYDQNIGDKNDSLASQFERLGIKKGSDLLLRNFVFETVREFQFGDALNRKIGLKLVLSQETGDWQMKLFRENDSASYQIGKFMPEPKYALLDIIPGGNKEIVILNEYYIMNGDNFDFEVFEII